MRLLVFQHIECEHPGSLRRFLKKDCVAWDAVNLDQGEAIPDLDNYDALWVMGGPMDVWDITLLSRPKLMYVFLCAICLMISMM